MPKRTLPQELLIHRIALLPVLLVFSIGCSHHKDLFRCADKPECLFDIQSERSGIEAKIHFLGVGGFAFEVDKQKVISAPFYSNFAPVGVFLPQTPDEKRIGELFPPELKDEESDNNVQAIIAGHAHYDHILDVPHLMDHQLKDAVFLGPKTAVTQVNIARGKPCDDYTRSAVLYPGVPYKLGNSIRITTFEASHAPHFLGITLMSEARNCSQVPRLSTPWGWKMGEVYAYLIDFLDEGKPVFRVFHQDTASDGDVLKIPRELLDAKQIDVATIVLTGFDKADRKPKSTPYPQSVIEATDAKLYLIGHWENFFSTDAPPRFMPLSNVDEYIEGLKEVIGEAEWLMLKPGRHLEVKTKAK